uniref:TAZ-type domain-containing protein n=1 Tax=Leersia perrieri TaxID=77586 RepID=A0A0D9V8W2_9ORYZ
MACLQLDSSEFLSDGNLIDSPFDIRLECNTLTGSKAVPDYSRNTPSQCTNCPDPPPLPGTSYGNQRTFRNSKACKCVPEEIQDFWDKLFFEAYQYDLRILADDGNEIMSHSCVVGIKSPVLRAMLEEAKVQDVPSLKRVCINQLEKSLLSPENVVDILQLARLCDAPRLSLVCTRMIIGDFKIITQTEGWRVMRQANPSLEQELLESLVEEDAKRQERARRLDEYKVYLQLHEAMEALVHICRDGCKTIGPRDQTLKSSQAICRFPACKGIELLLRHFSACKMRVPGGCASCKRIWQLLELHSRMCSTPEICHVPLCRHFKEKMQYLSRKEEAKWNLLVSKVLESKGTISSISARRKFPYLIA